ncbi:MAG: hypothetical protein JWN45_1419 [Acidobacteriaceae bacterium]|nr:hypothetical protein [Acidobacteriaceae bacterium]
MKTRTILLTLVFCFFSIVASFANDANVGTWKLNDAKSKIPAGASKNTTVVYTAEGDNLKCVTDGVDSSGNPTHTEWTGKPDGKDYPVTGDANADTRSLKMVSKRKYDLSNKKAGKPVLTGDIVFSPDGKTRTLTTDGGDPTGQKLHSVAVYDKQ